MNKENTEKPKFIPKFLWIPNPISQDFSLTAIDLRIWGTVYCFEECSDFKECFASNETLGKIVGSSERSVSRSLVKMEKKGYLKCIYKDEKRFERIRIVTCLDFVKVKIDRHTGAKEIDNQVPRRVDSLVYRENNIVREENRENIGEKEVLNHAPIKPLDTNGEGELISLYQALYKHNYSSLPKLPNYGRLIKILRELRGQWTLNQLKAMIFCHFEWRGLSGGSQWENDKLRENGFPLTWLPNSVTNYDTFLSNTLGEDVWNSDEEMGKEVDKMVKELSSKKKA